MQSGKTAGPDGYSAEFLKKFHHKLSKMLLEMFVDSLSQESLSWTLTEASIIFLLKPGKNSLDWGSYCPISLFNTDVTILAKVLALRLETTMDEVISHDQTGFISKRHSFR